jgi:hypothetical protein
MSGNPVTLIHRTRVLPLAAPDPRYRSKQFQTTPGKHGVAGARDQKTLFEPEFKMLYEKEKYTQQNWYNIDLAARIADPTQKPIQRENPKGFRSSDNAKRDEFSNSVRTAQWRENLKVRALHARALAPASPRIACLRRALVIYPYLTVLVFYSPRRRRLASRKRRRQGSTRTCRRLSSSTQA